MSRHFIGLEPVNKEAYGDLALIPVDRIELVHVDTDKSNPFGSVIWLQDRSPYDEPNAFRVKERPEMVWQLSREGE